jgi:SAM-dependent methyltransferase
MQEEKASGWDFTYVTNTGRMMESPLPWNYFVAICRHLTPGAVLLDLGTGGGEFLSLLPDKASLRIYATEGYAPNVALATKRLQTFGGTLIDDYTDSSLPFANDFFDLVIDRHESYDLEEIYRILKPGGYFITQQVDGKSDLPVAEVLQVKANEAFVHWDLAYALQEFVPTAFKIKFKQENAGFMRFYDAEALLFYIRSMPYLFQDYVDFDFAKIASLLADYFSAHPYLDVRKDRFLIVAQK